MLSISKLASTSKTSANCKPSRSAEILSWHNFSDGFIPCSFLLCLVLPWAFIHQESQHAALWVKSNSLVSGRLGYYNDGAWCLKLEGEDGVLGGHSLKLPTAAPQRIEKHWICCTIL